MGGWLGCLRTTIDQRVVGTLGEGLLDIITIRKLKGVGFNTSLICGKHLLMECCCSFN